MNKKEIKLGGTYSDGKGGVRRVVAEGETYKCYPHQQDYDCVQFEVVAKKRGPHVVGNKYKSTRTSFAKWAKKFVAA